MSKCQECGRSDEGMALAQTIVNNTIDQLRTELAAIQLQLKEAREALEYVKGCFEAAEFEGLSDRLSESDQDVGQLADLVQRRLSPALTAVEFTLSRHADTTALNRYVAEELRDIRERCSVADNPLAVIDERASELDPKRTLTSKRNKNI